MRLENLYYSINRQYAENENTHFQISLIQDCYIYEGHFPGMPVAPGVCNIQMIKELTERLTHQQLQLANVSQCRFSALINPAEHAELEVQFKEIISTNANIQVKAAICQGDTVFLVFKGEFIPMGS